MIDLSGFKDGDKFVLNNNDVVTLRCRTAHSAACEHNDGTMSLFHLNGRHDEYDHEGKVDSQYDIVSKHDPRHWLKDLPDADLFKDGWLSFSKHKGWLWSIKEPIKGSKAYQLRSDYLIYDISFLKMPKITGDEWKDSKIFTPELKAWQEQNK